MNESANKKSRERRPYRPEALSLEGRSLLSAGLANPGHGIVAQRIVIPGPKAPVTSLHAVISGLRASDGLMTAAPATFLSYSGNGNTTPFGQVLFGTQFQPFLNTANTYTLQNGRAQLITLKGGNQLDLQFTGLSATTRNGQIWSWNGIVNSGTGRFAGATGNFTATGSQVHGQGFVLKLNIIFNPAV